MIAIPQISQVFFGISFMGSIGYVLGRLTHTNAKLAASVLAITSLADHVLFYLADRTIRPSLNISPQALYIGTNACVYTVALLAANQLQLIGRRITGVGIFLSAAILAARLNILYMDKT